MNKRTNNFMPVSKEDLRDRGIEQLDFIIVTGDAYVDHPSFAHSLLGRYLELYGYSVGIIAEPDFTNVASFKVLGEPKYAFLISSGSVDSMVNNYSVFKKKRNKDVYAPGGKGGVRPDRATIVYCNKVKEAYKGVAVIIGGLEASLRRFAHYDYWDDKVRKSILLDSKADLLVYGMGERAILEIAEALASGLQIKDIRWIKGTAYRTSSIDELNPKDLLWLSSFKKIVEDKEEYAKSFMVQYRSATHGNEKILVESYGPQDFVVQNPMQPPLDSRELDSLYDLPFRRDAHPMYEELGEIPAAVEILFSITANRGCFGGCNFCAIALHQGKTVQGRSEESILKESKVLLEHTKFKGYIHDVGGPTANFRKAACKKQELKGSCPNRDCLVPEPCPNLEVDHQEYLNILRKLRKLEGVKKVFVRSGVRYDYALLDRDRTFIKELAEHHVSGQLKIAPEHIDPNVLANMGKPQISIYEEFIKVYSKFEGKAGQKQYVLPYFISSHPGSTLKEAINLAVYMKRRGIGPEQVQDFYPTPGTLSTCMYYTGLNPETMESVYVPRTMEEKMMQRALLHYQKKENYDLVFKALEREGRMDLVGTGAECLLKPKKR